MSIIKNLKSFAYNFPDRYAVIDSETTFTYRELENLSSKYAEFLYHAGVNYQDRVMICLTNSSWFVVMLMALEKLDVTIMPVNINTPIKDIKNISEEYNANFIITEKLIGKKFNQSSINIIYKEELFMNNNLKFEINKNVFNKEIAELQKKIIFFTSGTTGKPKGIVIKKECIIPTIYPDFFKESIKHLITRSIVFRPYFTLAYSIILQGDTIVFSGENTPEKISELLSTHEIVQMTSNPADLYKLADFLDDNKNLIPSYLKEISSTGRSLQTKLKEQLSGIFPNITIIDFYGSSEVGAICSIDNNEWDFKPGSSGKAECFVDLKIISENKKDLNIGLVGEICVKSKNSMIGYFNNPYLTNEVLLDGYVRTGDLGYLDEDQYLYLVGRNQEVINKGGYNFYCSELENLLMQLIEVRQAVVIPIEDSEWGQVPVAFIELSKEYIEIEKTIINKEIINFLNSNLDEFKLPKRIEIIRDMPLTIAGKIDKKCLISLI